jgi:hypothetical protein
MAVLNGRMSGGAVQIAAHLYLQADLRAAPDVLPEVWAKNSRIPGGFPGGA